MNGVIPPNLTPFAGAFALSEPALRADLEGLVSTPGGVVIACNGYAAKVTSLGRDERKRCLAINVDRVHDRVSIFAGIYADGTPKAIALSRDAMDAGAEGLLIFPPTMFMLAAQRRPDMVHSYFCRHRRQYSLADHRLPVPTEPRLRVPYRHLSALSRLNAGGTGSAEREHRRPALIPEVIP